MDKVICDICGTSFPATEDCCPVCGCSKEIRADLDLELEEEDLLMDSPVVAARKQKEQEASAPDPDDEEWDDEDEEDEEPQKSRTGVVILLVILIMLLLAAAGFLFLRYVLPNLNAEIAEPTESVLQTEAPVETTTDPGIPCQQLILTSGGVVDLTREGEYKLVNVIVKPEDTTDELTYVSSDETVVTVNEEGRITAQSEGEATITVICGHQRIECRVYVHYVEETEPPTEEVTVPATDETQDVSETEPDATDVPEESGVTEATEATEETVPEDETQPQEEETVPETQAQLKDVTLKLGRTDISLSAGYGFTIPLACDLEYEEIEWSVEHPYIATVKNGVVTAVSRGTTEVTAKYGDQEVTCMIRVK